MAEITSVLFFNVMHYDPKDPRNPAGDRFVLSKVSEQKSAVHSISESIS